MNDDRAPILVVGANRGLGHSLALRLRSSGLPVAASARPIHDLDALAHTLGMPRNHVLALDLLSYDLAATDSAIRALPPLSSMVFCAAVYGGHLANMSLADIGAWGAFYAQTLTLLRASVDRIAAGGGGRVILIGSVVGSLGRFSLPWMYSSSKGWLRLVAEGMNHEFASSKVSCSYLNLGSFRDDDVAKSKPGIVVPTSTVLAHIEHLISLPPTVRVEQSDLLPLMEMLGQ